MNLGAFFSEDSSDYSYLLDRDNYYRIKFKLKDGNEHDFLLDIDSFDLNINFGLEQQSMNVIQKVTNTFNAVDRLFDNGKKTFFQTNKMKMSAPPETPTFEFTFYIINETYNQDTDKIKDFLKSLLSITTEVTEDKNGFKKLSDELVKYKDSLSNNKAMPDSMKKKISSSIDKVTNTSKSAIDTLGIENYLEYDPNNLMIEFQVYNKIDTSNSGNPILLQSPNYQNTDFEGKDRTKLKYYISSLNISTSKTLVRYKNGMCPAYGKITMSLMPSKSFITYDDYAKLYCLE